MILTTHKLERKKIITTLLTIANIATPDVIRDFSVDDVVVARSVAEAEIEELAAVEFGGPALSDVRNT